MTQTQRNCLPKLPYLALVSFFCGGTLLAAGSDFTIDFTAAAPATYNHTTGGGAYNDRTIGEDVADLLGGNDFACGDIVRYFANIAVGGDGSGGLQTVELDFEFDAATSGQPGAALSEIVGVSVNYGCVENGAGAGPCSPAQGGLDAGISDGGGSVATLVSESQGATTSSN